MVETVPLAKTGSSKRLRELKCICAYYYRTYNLFALNNPHVEMTNYIKVPIPLSHVISLTFNHFEGNRQGTN